MPIDHTVTLHLVPLSDDAPPASWYEVLDVQERARAARFVLPVHRHRFVQRRAAMRTILADILALRPAQVTYALDAWGRLRLSPEVHRLDLNFSTSSSGALGLIAVTGGADLGVDLASVQPFDDLALVAARVFSDEELEHSGWLSGRSGLTSFFMRWTAMEASLKLDGRGLPALDQHPYRTTVHGRERLLNWLVFDSVHGTPYAAALASADHGVTTRWVNPPEWHVHAAECGV